MKLAVVNDVHPGKCLEDKDKVRASSHLVENVLHGFLEELIKRHSPDAALFLENHREIREMIFSGNSVIGVVQAHLHYFHTKKIDGIPYITCPAMGDNICGPNIKDNVPEIYTIFSFEGSRVMVKAFSGNYCFAGYEG